MFYFPFFLRTARSGIQKWTGIGTGTVESEELSAVLVSCNSIFKLQLLSEPLFPLHTIRGNKNGRVRIRVSSQLRIMGSINMWIGSWPVYGVRLRFA